MKKKNVGGLKYFGTGTVKLIVVFCFVVIFSAVLGGFSTVTAGSVVAGLTQVSYNNTVVTRLDVDSSDDRVWKGSYVIHHSDDLKKLSGYTTITGYLSIRNTNLSNLDGLEALTRIDDGLEIENNHRLSNIDGLKNLKSAEIIMVTDNPALANLNGFNSLTAVDDLVISSNSKIENLDSLNGITRMDSLMVNNNNALINIDGLSNIQSISGDLVVVGNDSLSGLSLNKLKTVGNNLYIYDNAHISASLSKNLVKQLVDFTGEVE